MGRPESGRARPGIALRVTKGVQPGNHQLLTPSFPFLSLETGPKPSTWPSLQLRNNDDLRGCHPFPLPCSRRTGPRVTRPVGFSKTPGHLLPHRPRSSPSPQPPRDAQLTGSQCSPSPPGCCGTGHTRPAVCSASPRPPSTWRPGPERGKNRCLVSHTQRFFSWLPVEMTWGSPSSWGQGSPTEEPCQAATLTEEGSAGAGGCFSSVGPFSLRSCSHSV